jgi:hypothetical protein
MSFDAAFYVNNIHFSAVPEANTLGAGAFALAFSVLGGRMTSRARQ